MTRTLEEAWSWPKATFPPEFERIGSFQGKGTALRVSKVQTHNAGVHALRRRTRALEVDRYTEFEYDAASDTFKPGTAEDQPPQANDAKCGFACHTILKKQDYVFTEYQKR